MQPTLITERRTTRMYALAACVLALALAASHSRAQEFAAGTRIEGMVYDSLQRRPLAGAMVQIVESPPGHRSFAATTDSAGRFRVDSVHSGSYVAGFLHPLLDSLDINAPYASVSITGRSVARIALAVPSAEQITTVVCGEAKPAARKGHGKSASDSIGMIVGHVRDEATGAPAASSSVIVEWPVVLFSANGARTETRQARASTNEKGWFAYCGLDAGEYQVRAESDGRATGVVDIVVSPRDVTRISLALGTRAIIATGASDSAAHGLATLAGAVITQDGHPLEGARVVVDGSSATATTDAQGAFVLSGLPDGTRMLEVRALGYTPRRVSAEPSSTEQRSVRIGMSKHVERLDAVTVRGRPRDSSNYTGFLARKQLGFGWFITREEIDRADVPSVCELLRRVPGVTVGDDGTPTGCTAIIRDAVSGVSPLGKISVPHFCEPTVYEDTIPFGGTVSDFTRSATPREIMGIEIYSAATQPPQFHGACGSIVIWYKTNVSTTRP